MRDDGGREGEAGHAGSERGSTDTLAAAWAEGREDRADRQLGIERCVDFARVGWPGLCRDQ